MWLEESLNLTNPTNKIIGGLNEQSNQNRSRIGFCCRCQWQSSSSHQPSPQGTVSAHSRIEGIELAKGYENTWQIVLQSQVFSVGFFWNSLQCRFACDVCVCRIPIVFLRNFAPAKGCHSYAPRVGTRSSRPLHFFSHWAFQLGAKRPNRENKIETRRLYEI